ncbi:MAG TPA: DUF2780 domain-containing protein [Gemmatimonadales bacterium]
MDLVTEVTTHLEIDQEDAVGALGALLTAVRFGVDAQTFEMLKDAIPQARSFLDNAAARSARTSEIVALTTPESLARRLRGAGHTDESIRKLGNIVREAVRKTVPPEAAERVVDAINRALP